MHSAGRRLVTMRCFWPLAVSVSMSLVAQPTHQPVDSIKDEKPRPWTPPLMPDGHPDLQGNWVNRSATPLERPKQLEGRQFLTDAEVDELRARADRIFK